MAYEIKYINKKSAGLIKALRQQTMMSSDAILQELQYLEKAITSYKESMQDSLDLNLEKADLVFKYKTQPTSGSYNLPGVMASSMAQYDMQDLKKDNARLGEIAEHCDEETANTELYFKMVSQNANDLIKRMKQLSNCNLAIHSFLEQLESASDYGAAN